MPEQITLNRVDVAQAAWRLYHIAIDGRTGAEEARGAAERARPLLKRLYDTVDALDCEEYEASRNVFDRALRRLNGETIRGSIWDVEA